MRLIETVRSGLLSSGAYVSAIGRSAFGTPILAAHVGSYGGAQIIVTAAMHARECFTALVALEQAASFEGRTPGGAYIVPLVNPDGAEFFESGLVGEDSVTALERFGEFPVLAAHTGDRLVWKANAEGVDLNTNFDANWGGGRHNSVTVGASDFVGAYPLCAAESRALWDLTLDVKPTVTVSYHCMGGELYWEFFQCGDRRRRDVALANAIANEIGVKRVDGHLFSAGGYKDACIERLKISAFTVELLSRGTHPFGADAFVAAAQKNAKLIDFILDYIYKVY